MRLILTLCAATFLAGCLQPEPKVLTLEEWTGCAPEDDACLDEFSKAQQSGE